jgi:hypothetical protein
VGGGLAALVAPWAVREHTVLTPETFVAPLLMAAALLATSRRRGAAVVGGAAAGLAGCFKVSWLISALALAIVARDRRRFTAGAIAAVAFVAAVSLALYGQPLIDSVITAQFQLGRTPPRTVLEYLEQAAWNLTPLALPALLAVRLRSHARDPLLLRTLLALALSSAVGLVSLAKEGSFLNVLVPMEPPLVALSAAGLWALVVDARGAGAGAGARARLAVALAALLLAGLQTAALLRSPGDPKLFRHPYAAAYYQRTLSGDEVDLEVRRARRCPRRLATSESPFVAFIARRRLPGNQGDPFIVGRAKVLARFKALARRDRPRCPRRQG